VINIAGALQLIPGVRKPLPCFFIAGMGAFFVLGAFTQAITGLYFDFVRGEGVVGRRLLNM